MRREIEKTVNLITERQLCQEKERRIKMKELCCEKLGVNLGETWEKVERLGRNASNLMG